MPLYIVVSGIAALFLLTVRWRNGNRELSSLLARMDASIQAEHAKMDALLARMREEPGAGAAAAETKPKRDFVAELTHAVLDHDHRLSAIEAHLARRLANASP